MSETDPNPATEPDDDAITAEVNAITQSPAEQQADKIKNALIAAKRENRDLSRKMKELEPIAARAQEIDGKLSQAQPIIDAVLQNPKLRAEALRIASGSRPSAETTEQPIEDVDARAYAEDMGWYGPDQQTPDAARARRVLNRIAGIARKESEDVVRPLAGLTLSGKAERNIQQAMAETDDQGVPLATPESIKEIAGQLPPNLLVDDKVVELVLNSAIGLDRRKGRTPKAQDEPLFLERPTGGRRAAPAISSDEKRMLDALGLTEDQYKRAGSRLETAVGSRKGVVLGGGKS